MISVGNAWLLLLNKMLEDGIDRDIPICTLIKLEITITMLAHTRQNANFGAFLIQRTWPVFFHPLSEGGVASSPLGARASLQDWDFISTRGNQGESAELSLSNVSTRQGVRWRGGVVLLTMAHGRA